MLCTTVVHSDTYTREEFLKKLKAFQPLNLQRRSKIYILLRILQAAD